MRPTLIEVFQPIDCLLLHTTATMADLERRGTTIASLITMRLTTLEYEELGDVYAAPDCHESAFAICHQDRILKHTLFAIPPIWQLMTTKSLSMAIPQQTASGLYL